MKHSCCIHCDELVSIPKSLLTDFVATLSTTKMQELHDALNAAIGLTEEIV